MCGVTGIYHYREADKPIDVDLLRRMTRALAHRGPDGENVVVEGPVGLGHRRLAIVDLSETGAQPMRTPDGKSLLSYNGEIYNHSEFRKRLEAKQVHFRGTSDSEVLLQALHTWGPAVLENLLGIFGFAFWNATSQRLLLGRDPLGVKQLYYFDDGKRILFASEIKALLECPDIPKEIDSEALNQYLHFHTPLFERTFFKGISQVLPGEYLEIDRHGVRSRLYWQLDGFSKRDDSPDEAVEKLQSLLQQAVSDQLMSDAPVGAFFSGGIDSSAVAAFAKRAGRPLHCFGVHFSGQAVIDERPFQESAASALGLSLELTTLDGSQFPEDMAKLIYFQDQPVIGAALLPMYYVSQLAARSVKVCLGGQAADEVFGGYARYALAQPTLVMSSFLRGRTKTSSEGRSNTAVHGNLMKQLLEPSNFRRAIKGTRHLLNWRERYFDHFAKVPERHWQQVFPGMVRRDRAHQTFLDTLNRSVAREPSDLLMHWELQTYLPGLFQQDDRMSMANSLESRVPLADPRLVRFAFHTPVDQKLRAGASKWILRKAVADVLPDTVLNRRKVGFDTPAEPWMRGPHQDFVRDTLTSAQAKSRGFWNAEGVRKTVEDVRHPFWFDRVWKLLCVELWSQVFLDAQRPVTLPQGIRHVA